MTTPQAGHGLPGQPSLPQLKKQAKELYRDACSEGPAQTPAHERLAAQLSDNKQPDAISLADTQLTLAREHGFASWTQLKRYVEHVSMSFDEKVDAFVNAALFGSLDHAQALLDDNPKIAHAALVCDRAREC